MMRRSLPQRTFRLHTSVSLYWRLWITHRNGVIPLSFSGYGGLANYNTIYQVRRGAARALYLNTIPFFLKPLKSEFHI